MGVDSVAANTAVAEALGLDPHDVRAVTIRLRVGSLPTVEVEYSPRYAMEHALPEALARFELLPAPSDKPRGGVIPRPV